MELSTTKTKSIVIARCKLEPNNKIIDHVFEFYYLGITISPYGEFKNGVRNQVNKAPSIAGAL